MRVCAFAFAGGGGRIRAAEGGGDLMRNKHVSSAQLERKGEKRGRGRKREPDRSLAHNRKEASFTVQRGTVNPLWTLFFFFFFFSFLSLRE